MKTFPKYAINFASFLPGDLEVCLESHREQLEGRVDGCDTGPKVAEYLRLMFQTMGCPALQVKEPQMARCGARDRGTLQSPWPGL